jgi:hypothetical protein
MKINALLVIVCCFSLISCVNANSKTEDLLANRPQVTHQLQTPATNKAPKIQVALLLDTSNSMDGLIDQARAQLWDIVNELSLAKCDNKAPTLSIALYEYGNSNLSQYNGYTRKVLEFTQDLDDVSKALFSLTTNGGNEYCGAVVQTAVTNLKWDNETNVLKLIFIAGNEPYTQGHVNYVDASQNAKEHNITVNTMFCGNYNHGVSSYWRDGAQLTGGDYMAIDHNKAIVHIASPYDDEILKLNTQLNTTYIPYGSYGLEKAEVQMSQDDNAMSYNESSAIKRAVSKTSHLYTNKSWDLVDAVMENEVQISKLNTTQLPKELQGKTAQEIEAYITLKTKERKQLQEKIQQLNTKRKNYIAKENVTTNTTNNLQSAMLAAIKKQAEAKHFYW